jgi:hypothetical protein
MRRATGSKFRHAACARQRIYCARCKRLLQSPMLIGEVNGAGDTAAKVCFLGANIFFFLQINKSKFISYYLIIKIPANDLPKLLSYYY